MLGSIGKVIGAHKTLAVIIALVMVGGAVTGIVAWEHVSTEKIKVTAATSAYDQTVYFNGTNAQSVNPVMVGNQSGVTSSTANFTVSSQTYITTNATYSVSASGLTPGHYVKFVVALKNAGTTTLALNETGVNFFMNETETFANGTSEQGYILNATSGKFQLAPAYLPISEFAPPETLTTYTASLNQSPYNNTWDIAFGSNGVQHIAPTLAPGQTFYYSVYVGLGVDASSTTMGSSMALTFSIPLMVAQ